MKVRDAITWANSLLELQDWCHLSPDQMLEPEVRMWFETALETCVKVLSDRDFSIASPVSYWVPGVGEVVPAEQVVTDREVPWRVKAGVYEFVRAALALKSRSGGMGLGLASGSAGGVSESYTPLSAQSVIHGAEQAAIPFWNIWQMPCQRGSFL